MAFDVGVFLTVLGAVMLALAELSLMGKASDPDLPSTPTRWILSRITAPSRGHQG